MSANTIKKAEKLVESGGVIQIEDDLFQIKSSSESFGYLYILTPFMVRD